MAYKEKEIAKLYYSIGEVSAMFGVNASLLRFYEKEFDIIQPKKNKKGNRYFTVSDVENLKLIIHLIREKRYTIEGAKAYLKTNIGGAKSQQRIIESLENMRAFLIEVRDNL